MPASPTGKSVDPENYRHSNRSEAWSQKTMQIGANTPMSPIDKTVYPENRGTLTGKRFGLKRQCKSQNKTQVWLCVSCHSTKILPVGTPVAILGLYSKALSTRNTHSHTHGGSREDNINQRTEHTQQRQHQTSMPRNTSNIITPHG